MKALMSLIWKSPQSSRQSDIAGRGAGGACMPVSARKPSAATIPRFSIIRSSALFLRRDIGGIMGEGQIAPRRQRAEHRAEIGAGAKAEQPLGTRRIVDPVDEGRQRPAPLRVEARRFGKIAG